MRHTKYSRGVVFRCDCQFRCPSVVMGRRPEPAPPVEPPKDAPEDERAAWSDANRKFRLRQTGGYFADQVLEWCVDEAEANRMEEHFKADGWINVRTEPVDLLPRE